MAAKPTQMKPAAPDDFSPEFVLFEDIPPYGDWILLRRSIPRRRGNELRQILWDAGLFPHVPQSSFTAQQWRVFEQDWVNRMVLQTRAWSFTLAEDDGEQTLAEGTVLKVGDRLPISEEGVGLLPDRAYQRICSFLNELLRGSTAEEAKSKGLDAVGLGVGDAGESPQPPAGYSEDGVSASVVA